MNIIMLSAVFSKEIYNGDTYVFPYLGQLAFLGLLDTLTWACKVPPIRAFCPAYTCPEVAMQLAEGFFEGSVAEVFKNAKWPSLWFQPEDAWKTLDSLHDLMLCRGTEGFLKFITDIRNEVADECRDLRFLLDSASRWDCQFKFELQEMKSPPFALLEWTNSYMKKNVQEVQLALEIAGIAVYGESGNE